MHTLQKLPTMSPIKKLEVIQKGACTACHMEKRPYVIPAMTRSRQRKPPQRTFTPSFSISCSITPRNHSLSVASYNSSQSWMAISRLPVWA